LGEIFEKLCKRENFELAWQRVLRKNAAGGIDGLSPTGIDPNIDKTINDLIQDLRTGRYIPLPYARGQIPKFNEENEWRDLSLPAVKDKIVQQVFVQAVEDVFEPMFLDCSYAYRKGKGPVRAIARVEHILTSAHVKWVATLDIDNFFDSLGHEILVTEIRRKINEPEVLNLITLWLNTGIISARGEWDAPHEGIGQGSIVSPLFSNVYLHKLDELAIQNQYHYIRYSDNFILLAETKDSLYISYERLKAYLEESLKLRLNDNPYPFKSIDHGFAFLGVYFKGALRRISYPKETKIYRKLSWLTDKASQRDPKLTIHRLNESVEGSQRYYGFIQPVDQFREFDQHLLKRLKFLFSFFIERKMLPSWDDAVALSAKINFFTNHTISEKQDIFKSFFREIQAIAQKQAEPKQEESPIPDPAAQAKRQSAQQNRYVKKISDQSEISISTPGIFIGKTSNRLVVREQRKNIIEIPFQKVKNISIHANGVSFSSDLIYQCSQNHIPITFYSFKGMPIAVLQSPLHSMGSLSVMQIKAYETEKAMCLVKKTIAGKSKNQLNLMKFYLRSRKENHADFAIFIKENEEKMKNILKELSNIQLNGDYSVARDRIFSMEARISALYWEAMKKLVPPDMGFVKRDRYQATDIVNCLLNYGYGILYQRVWQAVSATGLNPHISFLHAFQANKPTLVYDLIEEFRQPFVDRAIFSLLTKGKKGTDLKVDQQTGLLNKGTKEQAAKAVLGRLNSLLIYRDKKIKGEDIIKSQVSDVASYIKDGKGYKPFISGY